jgi:hypothetical protein
MLYFEDGAIGSSRASGGFSIGTGAQIFLVGAEWLSAALSRPNLAQAMEFASFEDVRWLETALGRERLSEAMLSAQPGWIGERSWEFWRGRLGASGGAISESPPRRSFDDS